MMCLRISCIDDSTNQIMGAFRKCEQNAYLKWVIENSDTPVTAVYKLENYGVHLKGSSFAQHCARRRWLQDICKEPHEYGTCSEVYN